MLPFTALMCEWSNSEWPYEGSFEECKLQLAEAMTDSSRGNPAWDFKYMRVCVQVWREIAFKLQGEVDRSVGMNEKRCDAVVSPLLETAKQQEN